MFPAERADSISDSIRFPEGYTVHPLVQLLKGGFDSIGIGVIALMVIREKHLQDGLGIAAVVGVGFLPHGVLGSQHT